MLEFICVFAVFYIWHALGVTIGYHRLLSHRSFTVPKLVEYFWVLPGYLAFEGSPIWWATMHRAHHKHVDTPLDPHSPRYGLKNAHVGWLTKTGYASHIDPQSQGKDLLKDPIYRFLEQNGVWSRAHFLAFAIGVSFRVALLAIFGWQIALASALAGVAVLQIPLMLNVVCHIPRLGYKTYATTDDSVNVWWVGILAMGEGWHNNHHACPGSAKTGMGKSEFDLSWIIINNMRKIGLATRVNECTHEQMLRLTEASNAREKAAKLPEPIVASSPAAIAAKTAPAMHSFAASAAFEYVETVGDIASEKLPPIAKQLTKELQRVA